MRRGKLLMRFLMVMLLIMGIAGSAFADGTRYKYDYNFPKGAFSIANFQATLRGLHQMDMMPLRPLASFEVDGMEYGSNSAAQAEYSGTGVTITTESSAVQEGSYSLKAVIDGTDNRAFERTFSINLSAFDDVVIWERSSTASDTLRFYVEDSSGNQSYWNLTADGSADTWKQHTLDLSSPDGNSGTAATLSDISAYGYSQLTASATYYFDTVELSCGMNVAVMGTDLGSYYKNVHLVGEPVAIDASASPTITAPSSNPRIDILVMDSSGTLTWVTGTEASSPSAPWSSVSAEKIPICLVYAKTTMVKVVNYEDKDIAGNTNEGYILADVRPFLNLGGTVFTQLGDTPSSFSGNAGEFVRVNTGETALEFAELEIDPVEFSEQASDPTVLSNKGYIYSKDSGGYTELFFRSDGGVVQITDEGELTNSGKVLADSGDSTYGYLSDKVDGITITVNGSDQLEAQFLEFSVGDTVIAQAVNMFSLTNTSYQKKVEFYINNGGSLRISFDLQDGGSGSEVAYGRIYRNGVAVGTERSQNSSGLQTFTEDISGWSPGDKVQLYLKHSSGGGNSGGNLKLKSSEYGGSIKMTTGTADASDFGYIEIN